MEWEILNKSLLLSWFIINFEPIRLVLNGLEKKINGRSKEKTIIKFIKRFDCIKCLSFWITLGWSYDPFLAITAALIAYTYDRLMNAIPMYL